MHADLDLFGGNSWLFCQGRRSDNQYGVFINTVLDFVIVAFAIFMVIRGMNKMKKKEEEKPAEPPKPSAEAELLAEIRDALKTRG